MKGKKYVILGFVSLLLSFSGCNKVDLGPLPTLAPTASVTSEVLTEQSEEHVEHVTPQITSKTEIEGQQEVYHGATYKFYEVDEALYLQDPDLSRYKIRSVYEDVFLDSSYNGLFVGQVVTMFGDRNVTNNYEALLSYIVAAEDEAGDMIYLEVYFGPSGPAIGGSAGENYAKAAEELEAVIRSIEPIDYECECTYFDLFPFGGGTVMGTKGGKGYYRTEMGGNWY